MKYHKILFMFAILGIISIPLRHYVSAKIDVRSGFADSKIYGQSSPPCVEMFSAIEKYAKVYDIPLKYALGIAYAETRYSGPFDWGYNPERVSVAGALGPMQIMPSTAEMMWNEKIPKDRILSDIDFNVETSMKLLRYLHDRYGNWKTVFGCYNTGRPCVNGYAEQVYNFNPKNI